MTNQTATPHELLAPDMPAQTLRHHMGEMTAQEMRSVRAAIRWANSQIINTLDSPALVDEVAKALSQWRHDRNLGLPTWDELEEHVKKAYRDQAQAAIAAIRKALC